MIQRYGILIFVFLFVGACASKTEDGAADFSMNTPLGIVDSVSLESEGSADFVRIKGSQEFKYNVFKLLDPERIVVDILDTQKGASVSETLAGSEVIQEISVKPIEDSLSTFVRLEIVLKSSANYIANQDADGLVIRVVRADNLSFESSQPIIAAEAPLLPSEISDDSEASLEPAMEKSTPEESLAVAPPAIEAPSIVPEMPPAMNDRPKSMTETPALASEVPSLVSVAPKKVEEMPIESQPLPSLMGSSTEKVTEKVAEADIVPLAVPVLDSDLVPLPADTDESKFPEPKKAADLKKRAKASSLALKPVQAGDITGTLGDSGSLLTDLDTKIYTGRRISLEFQDADVDDILRLLADVSKLNIVTGDDVKGKLTLKLIDVPWDQALDIALATLGLDKIQHGNIIRVAPSEKLRREREVALANDRAAKQLEPLRIKLLNVNYAKASDIAARVKNLLSERGTVDIDSRTNTLIVKDIREHIEKSENLLKALDTQTPQVRIEARIVLADDDNQKSFGVQWGPSLRLDDTNSKERSWQFPRTIAAGNPDAGRISLGTFMVDNLPGNAQGGGLGFRLGSINNIFNLDMQLRYLESERQIRVVSRPSVSVLDNRPAKIVQGNRVPFVTSSSTGTNVSFQEVGISIDVTPQITSDGAVILKVETKNNEVGNSAVGGNPIVTIREASSEMLVKSGRTAVLGGVFKTTDSASSGGVPGLMRLPLLGWLFSNSNHTVQREETLIFITPYILSDNRMAVTAASSESSLEP